MGLYNGCSLIIHTKNEQENIKDCIESAKGLFDEVIIIDMQSSDKTVKLARGSGAKVYKFKDIGFADPARNFGISKAKYKWILSLDADERLSKSLVDKLFGIIQKDKYDLVRIPHKNYIFNKWIKHTGWWPDYHFRLFKKGHLTYFDTVHTQPKVEGRVLTLKPSGDNAILHRGVNSVSQLLEKYNTYSGLENHFSQMGKIRAEELILFAESEFINRYIGSEGYKDGLHGFMLSKFRELYRYIEFAKYWEKQGFEEIIDSKSLQKLVLQRYKGDVKKNSIAAKISLKIKSIMNFIRNI